MPDRNANKAAGSATTKVAKPPESNSASSSRPNSSVPNGNCKLGGSSAWSGWIANGSGGYKNGATKPRKRTSAARISPAASVGRAVIHAIQRASGAAGMPGAEAVRSLIAGPGVEQAIDQIGEQIADHGEQADDQHDGDQHRVILRQCRTPHQPAEAGIVEHRFDDHAAGENIRERQAEHR